MFTLHERRDPNHVDDAFERGDRARRVDLWRRARLGHGHVVDRDSATHSAPSLQALRGGASSESVRSRASASPCRSWYRVSRSRTSHCWRTRRRSACLAASIIAATIGSLVLARRQPPARRDRLSTVRRVMARLGSVLLAVGVVLGVMAIPTGRGLRPTLRVGTPSHREPPISQTTRASGSARWRSRGWKDADGHGNIRHGVVGSNGTSASARTAEPQWTTAGRRRRHEQRLHDLGPLHEQPDGKSEDRAPQLQAEPTATPCSHRARASHVRLQPERSDCRERKGEVGALHAGCAAARSSSRTTRQRAWTVASTRMCSLHHGQDVTVNVGPGKRFRIRGLLHPEQRHVVGTAEPNAGTKVLVHTPSSRSTPTTTRTYSPRTLTCTASS